MTTYYDASVDAIISTSGATASPTGCDCTIGDLSFDSINNPSFFAFSSGSVTIKLSQMGIPSGIHLLTVHVSSLGVTYLVSGSRIVLSSGFLVEDVNSYCTIEEADQYHLTRLSGNDTWMAAGVGLREFYLKAACDFLETISWTHPKYDDNQALEWPKLIDGESSSPKEVKYAQAEIALQLMLGQAVEGYSPAMKMQKMTLISKTSSVFTSDRVRRLLAPYVSNGPKLVRV